MDYLEYIFEGFITRKYPLAINLLDQGGLESISSLVKWISDWWGSEHLVTLKSEE